MEELKIRKADVNRQNTLEAQIKIINEEFDKWSFDSKAHQHAILLEKTILLPEIEDELIKEGYDVTSFKGINLNNSWTEISWYDAKKGKEGTKKYL